VVLVPYLATYFRWIARMAVSCWGLSFRFDTERSGVYINTRGWSGPINFRAAKVLYFFLFLIHKSFRRVPVCPGRWRSDISLPLSNKNYTVVLKTCNEVMFFISVMPSEIRRFKFTVSWPYDDHIVADTFVVKGSRQRATTAPSPRCRRTTVFKD
jgi:hypothetical protein